MDGPTGLIGVGLYTVPEASLLTRVPSARIRRWISGYTYLAGDRKRQKSAVWQRQLPRIEKRDALGFQDLMEVRFVHAFLEIGVSLQAIRLAALHAQKVFSIDHPFSSRKFRSDGKRIFAELKDEEGK